MSLNYLATRFTCSWPWETLVLLCDGRIVCGCADPYAKRVLGDARRSRVSEIWTGSAIHQLRTDLNHGGSTFCGDCPLKLPLDEQATPRERSLDVAPLPQRLYVECTAACNLSCFQACCAPETGITRTRQAGMLDFELFRKVIDEAGPTLGRVDFFNYGEAFLHKRAVEMCEYIKSRYPHIYLYTSTNGLAFSEDAIRRLINSGIDEVTFSIDGATPESYVRYRQRGDFARVMRNLHIAVDEKRRAALELPIINWRYILFAWNDSDAEMQQARRTAANVGVDRLCWEITDHPEEAFSRRFAPGTEPHAGIRHEIWDDNNLGNAIPGCTPRARIELRSWSANRSLAAPAASRAPAASLAPAASRASDASLASASTASLTRSAQAFAARAPEAALQARAGDPALSVSTRVRNLCQRPFPAQGRHGRRLVRLGAQLAQADGTILTRDHARAWLPQTIDAGARADINIDVPVPTAPGRYLLRFDLVSEGIDWFEACGSEPTVRPFDVL